MQDFSHESALFFCVDIGTLFASLFHFCDNARSISETRVQAGVKRVLMSTGVSKDISSKYCSRFGRIAVEMGFITGAQLDDALRSQIAEEASAQGLRLLATILFDKGWMTSEQIEQVLNALMKNRD